MGNFRIAFGAASCRNTEGKNDSERKVCAAVLERLERLRSLNAEQLKSFKSEEQETLHIDGKKVRFTTFVENRNSEGAIVVVQAFYPTLWLPTYLSLSGVGKVFTEGLLVHSDGRVTDAADKDLWAYR